METRVNDWALQVDTKPPVYIDTQGGYSFEQVMWNKNTSKKPQYWYRIAGTDRFLFKSSVAESWEFKLPSVVNPIRNMDQIYLYFKDVSSFVETQNRYKRDGYYTNAAPSSPLYERFWDEEETKIIYGKITDGVRISGRQYFMLNFGRMRARDINEAGEFSKRKKLTFPSFLDIQYYIINEAERWVVDSLYADFEPFSAWFPLATKQDHSLLVKESGAMPKARRKGFTAVNGIAFLTYNYAWIEESFNIVGAYQKDFYTTLFSDSIKPTIDFLNDQTPWKRRSEVKDTSDWFKASYREKNEAGIFIEKGIKSEIKGVSYGGTAFAGVGKSGDMVFIEEAGKFNNLLDTLSISVEPLIKDGDDPIGSAIIGGTAGEMSSDGGGGSYALSVISYNPESYGLKSYKNIYEEDPEGNSSLFIDAMWFFPLKAKKAFILDSCKDSYQKEFVSSIPGEYAVGVDAQGNSYRFIAEIIIDKNLEVKKKAGTKPYNNYRTQYPKYLSDAFLVSISSPFDKSMARAALARMATKRTQLNTGEFIPSPDGGIIWRQDLSLHPITSYHSADDEEGCFVMYAPRIVSQNTAHVLRYIAGFDPIDKGYEEASSDNTHSKASLWIMDTFTEEIVAEYTGRPARAKHYYRQAALGLQYYNAKVMYENNLAGFFQYCATNKLLTLLADEPAILKNKAGYKMGKVGTKGYHATASINGWLLELVADWLAQDVYLGQDPDTGEPIMASRYYSIQSKGLLEEIEKWRPDGNFDRISALGALLLYFEQTRVGREYTKAQENKKDKGVLFTAFRKKYLHA